MCVHTLACVGGGEKEIEGSQMTNVKVGVKETHDMLAALKSFN